MACDKGLLKTSIQLATVTAALGLTLTGCSGNNPQTTGTSPTASSTASADATELTSETTKTASMPTNGSAADTTINVAKKSVTGKAAPLKRPRFDAAPV